MQLVAGIRRLLPAVCLFWMAWAHPALAAGPSFTCQKASHPVEKLICANPELSAADVEMARRYGEVMTKAPADDKQGIQIEQERWLKSRNTCAAGAELQQCVLNHYQARIERLKAFQALYASGSGAATGPEKKQAKPPAGKRR